MFSRIRYIVIGAGISGSVIAERIANDLKEDVLVIEKRDHIGGACYDYLSEEGILIQRYGPHIFHTNHDEVYEYLSKFTEWIPYEHKVLANIEGKRVPVPFNFRSIDLLFPEYLAERIKEKLVLRYGFDKRVTILELMKIDDYDINILSNFVYNKVFLNYSKKQWGRDPERLDPEILSRVPVYVGYDDRYFYDKYQLMPKEGFTKIFERMLSSRNIKLLLNTDYKELIKVDLENNKILLDNEEFRGTLIVTGMIDEFFNYKLGKLEYRSLRFKLEKVDREYFQEVAVVNYPNEFDFTRISEFKHFYNRKSDKTYILFEYPLEYDGTNDPYYPILDLKNKEIYERYSQEAKRFKNLYFLGRLAEHKYKNMDVAVLDALKLYNEIKR
ncbi:MAG: UDP-galactopyranose mutase [Candidatus Woesearchaeota archaeon]